MAARPRSLIYATARSLRAVAVLAWLFLAPAAGAADNPAAAPIASVPQASPGGSRTGAAGAKAQAKQLPSKPSWAELTPAQQTALAPLASEWDKLDGYRKKKWLEIGKKYSTMKPDEQTRLQQRMREWAKLTPEQRRAARESYARAKKLNPDQKTAHWQEYQRLPEEQKQKLAKDAAAKKHLANPPPAKSRTKTMPPAKAVAKSSTPAVSSAPPAAPVVPVPILPAASAPVPSVPEAPPPAAAAQASGK